MGARVENPGVDSFVTTQHAGRVSWGRPSIARPGDGGMCRAAIWIGVESHRPLSPPGATPKAAKQVAAFIDHRFPGARIAGPGPGSFYLRCAGSLKQVMHMADDLGWHVRHLAGSEDVETFTARIGVVIARDGESIVALLHRAENEAQEVGGAR